MKQLAWKIVYHKYEGLEKKAVDFLSKEAGKYLIRENDLYRLYVLPCEEEGAQIEQNAFVIGTWQESATIRAYVKEQEIKENGYLVKVVKNPENESGRIVVITAKSEKELFYGAVSFIDDYLAECAPAHGFVRLRQFTFDEPMKEWSYSETADNQTRSVFTWGHPISDYRAYIDNMARLKLDQLIIWNDHMPINVQDVIDYAHSYGIEIIFGYAWGWIDGCGKITDISDARLKELKDQIIAHYEDNYAKLNCDGIYFQSFTERSDEYIGGRLIAEAATTLVNDTARALLDKYPSLKLQFGLHAISVKNHLEEIAKVDSRIEILWEDCGAFPYDYSPAVTDEKKFEETLAFTEKILNLRGNAPVGLVFKGVMMLDWTAFVSQRGRYVMGNNAGEIVARDRRMRDGAWRIFSAEWMQYGNYAKRMLEFIKQNAHGTVNCCMAGTFDGGIYFPQAVLAQLFRHVDEDYGETMKRVARRDYVELG
ncbi:MAG: hypothetical protein J6R04_07225 [Clostridia bacterium]|nr:hypothetical protein [Clostridia bacterium]